MQQSASVTVTIANPTAGQMLALNDILGATVTPSAVATAKAGKKTKPAKTVSDEEEESFGTEAVEEEELEEEETEESEESEEEEDALSFDQVKEAINTYGNKKPEDMKAILLGFNMKSTKELEKHKTKWEPVYRKVMAKLKASKKAK